MISHVSHIGYMMSYANSDLLGYVIMYVKLLKNKTDIYILSDKESVISCRRNRY